MMYEPALTNEPALTKEGYDRLQNSVDSPTIVHLESVSVDVAVVDVAVRVQTKYDNSFLAKGSCSRLPPETMFGRDATSVAAAKAICAECVVLEPCRSYALDKKIEYGVWGGLGEYERRKILKQRRVEESTSE